MASGRIPDEMIDEIRQQADIVGVISEYVALTQTGKNYKGLCPFHQEKTPSFVVSPDKQIFHCYGCGTGGNVFSFLMKYEKYSFPEAVRILARRTGIRLPEKPDSDASHQLGRKDLLYQLHREVARYFMGQLTQSKAGQSVLEYLQQRGIDASTTQAFVLGYASPAWDDIQKYFVRKYPMDLLLESGLVIKRREGAGQYDRFRDRLMVPISDDRGRVIAFGGRILGDGEPKYLNSPESPIFQKSQVLFGLHQAKQAVRQQGYILIVEGYFDMIVPFSLGVQNVAATMGTALTQQHLRMLQRYTRKVVLMFDADPAGIRAVQRTLDLFLTSGFEVRAAILPKGDDPDTAIRKMGIEQFQQYISQAPLLLDFIRERILEQYDLSRIDQRVACANQILATIVKIQNIPERNEQINQTAYLLSKGMRDDDPALLQAFKKAALSGKARIATPKNVEKPTALPPLERFLVKALLKDKRLISYVQQHALEPLALSHPVTRKVVEELLVYGDKTDFEARILECFQNTPYQAYLTELFLQVDEVVQPEATVQDCLERLQQRGFEHITVRCTKRLQEAQQRKDEKDTLDAMLRQKNQELQKKRKFFKKNDFPLEK